MLFNVIPAGVLVRLAVLMVLAMAILASDQPFLNGTDERYAAFDAWPSIWITNFEEYTKFIEQRIGTK